MAVKLPQFYSKNARFWFARAEANFRTCGVTREQTMFDHVVQHLDMETAGRLMDIIENPGSNPYQAIKQAILRSHTPTDRERASAILDWPGLGGCRPSQCLKDMIQVMPTGVTDLGILFKEVFLRQLGKEVRALLAPSANNNASTVVALRALALEADQYYESSGARVNAIVEKTEAMIFNQNKKFLSES